MEGNFIVFKNTANNFYLINEVYHPELIDFGKPSFEMKPGYDASNQTIWDFICIPKNRTYSKRVEILIAHPEEGVMILDDNKVSDYSYNFNKFCEGIDKLGKITHFALSYDK